MRSRSAVRVVQGIAAVLVAGGLVVVGRLTAGPQPAVTDASSAGRAEGYETGYLAGLRDGVAQGREEGRSLQEASAVPAESRGLVRAAFTGGYAAGANDVFAGYDGGWGLSEPYVITVEKATSPIAYRIASRTPMRAGVSYVLCDDGRSLCQEPRR